MIKKLTGFLFWAAKRLITWSLLAVSVFALAMTVVIDGPQIYANFIRLRASRSVVTLHVNTKNSYFQGTGFHIMTPSGKKVMLTNRHLCEDSTDGYVLAAYDQSERFVRKKIIRMAKDTDLCLVEPMRNSEPLPFARTFLAGEKIITAGHPSGLPLTIDYGQVLGVIWSETSRPATAQEVLAGKCQWDNDHMERETGKDGKVRTVCHEANRTVMTTAEVVGGSSGSPMLNRYGQVVGIVFLRHENNYAGAISLRRINEFLKNE